MDELLDEFERRKIMERASTYWSEEQHADQLEEECGELLVAMKHYKRGRISLRELVKEMADVSIMIEQYERIFAEEGISFIEIKDQKLRKMLNLMANGDI